MPKTISIRRNIQQAGHCVSEALSIVEHGEEAACAVDDLHQARELIDTVLKRIHSEGIHAGKGTHG